MAVKMALVSIYCIFRVCAAASGIINRIIIFLMYCVRVRERTLLVDAIKDLVCHVDTAADKVTITDAIRYFTSQDTRTDNSICRSSEISTSDENISVEEVSHESSFKVDDNGMENAEVSATTVNAYNSNAVKSEHNWKLYIRVHGRMKDKQSFRYS